MEQIYSVLSDVSHVRRSGLRSMVSVPLRRAVYRAHPDPVARAHGTVSTLLAVEATILGVGDALAVFYGGPYYAQIIKPIQAGLMASVAQLIALTDSVRRGSDTAPSVRRPTADADRDRQRRSRKRHPGRRPASRSAYGTPASLATHNSP